MAYDRLLIEIDNNWAVGRSGIPPLRLRCYLAVGLSPVLVRRGVVTQAMGVVYYFEE